jgi:dTDP-4-dehydrorhamnose 3,5-epimerase-like enzyme
MTAFAEGSIQKLGIDGVYLVDFEIHSDTRGFVYEVIHASDRFVNQIHQVYHVCNPRADTVRAFHAHERLHDWFHIVSGSALFCLVDGREDQGTYEKTERLVLSDRNPQLLVVPSGVYHGWMSLEPNTILTSVASEEYQRERPDERRVPPNHFDYLFGGNPWRVDAR